MARPLSKLGFIFLLALPFFLSQCGVKGPPRPEHVQDGPLTELEKTDRER